jgi:hypothetical protein
MVCKHFLENAIFTYFLFDSKSKFNIYMIEIWTKYDCKGDIILLRKYTAAVLRYFRTGATLYSILFSFETSK